MESINSNPAEEIQNTVVETPSTESTEETKTEVNSDQAETSNEEQAEA